MTIDINDPKLTAYVLNELDDAERAQVEALLEQSPEAACVLAEIRRTASMLTEELTDAAPALLTDAQRQAIERRAAAQTPVRTIRLWIPFSAAAAILLLLNVVVVTRNQNMERRLGSSSLSNIRSVGAAGGLYSNENLEWYPVDSYAARGAPSQAVAARLRAMGYIDYSATGPDPQQYDRANVRTTVSSGELGASRVFFDVSGDRKFRVFLPHNSDGTSDVTVVPGLADDVLRYFRLSVPRVDEIDLALGEGGFNAESYARIHDNPFLFVSDNPLSTFSIDVDTASYANIRRFLNDGQLPPPDAVRIEEMINYFIYDYSPPEGDDPFGVNVEVAECPWTPEHRLVRIGLQGMVIEREDRPASNLVFLIDVSGSMSSNDKLPLLKQSLALLTQELDGYDRVAMVVYAGSSGLVLPSTTADNTDTILHALESLSAGGSTNGGEGIQLAYDVATENFIEGGVNRVILATDGDFNVGITDQSALTRLIEEKAKSGVFLSVLGFGTGNLKDATMEKLADNGNGNYAYIDSLDEGRKVLVEQMGGTLITIAKDVKIQIEFNPAEVAAYRLIGYANRMLAARDFNDDTKDAGEIGAGHTVTALYEIVPAGQDIEVSLDGEFETPEIDPLRYQAQADLTEAADSGELMTLKLRYKHPDGDVSRLMEYGVRDDGASLADSSEDFRFASAVASFGMLLRRSEHAGGWTLEAAAELAAESIGEDPAGYRREFLGLIERAAELRSR